MRKTKSSKRGGVSLIQTLIILVVGLVIVFGLLRVTGEKPAVVNVQQTATSTPQVASSTPEVATSTKRAPTPYIENASAAELFKLTNADRKAAGVKQVRYSLILQLAAQRKVDDMVAKGYFAHVSPEGVSFRFFLDGVRFNYSYAGENLAEGFDTMKAAEIAFMASPTHRENIVKSEYTDMGIALARGVCGSKDTCGGNFGKEVQLITVIFATDN